MIQLHLSDARFQRQLKAQPRAERQVSLAQAEASLHTALTDLEDLLNHQRQSTIYIPTDVLIHAATALLPPERMGVVAGRWMHRHFVLTTMYDVTGAAHRAHVRADPQAISRALVEFDAAGVELALWIHSHPGAGPLATTPSAIDRHQFQQWTRDFDRLLAAIVVGDGYIRLWGEPLEAGRVRIELMGEGLVAVGGQNHVYRIRA